jgi:4'-phosphopantetheinyl transferase EntD
VVALAGAALLIDLGPGVVSAGYLVDDYQHVISELTPLFAAESLSPQAVPKRRAEFLAGRFAARQAMRALGVDARVERDEQGRPIWPSNVAGSITHGAGRALSAAAHAAEVRGIGIDAERLMGASTQRELMTRICNEAELATLAARLDVPEPARVTFAFSAKESLYKCLYPLVGRFMDFSAARVVDASTAGGPAGLMGELLLELAVDWAPGLSKGFRLSAAFAATEQHVETGVVLRP